MYYRTGILLGIGIQFVLNDLPRSADRHGQCRVQLEIARPFCLSYFLSTQPAVGTETNQGCDEAISASGYLIPAVAIRPTPYYSMR
jgi:hypothetical protein